jgi:hypothetical protein
MAKSWTIRKNNQIIGIYSGEAYPFKFPTNEGNEDEIYKIECRDESGYTATLDYAIKPCSGPPKIKITYKSGSSEVETINGFIFNTDKGKLRLNLSMRDNDTSDAIITDEFIGAVITSVTVIDSDKYSYSSTLTGPTTIMDNGEYTIKCGQYKTIGLLVKYYLSFSEMEKGKLKVALNLNDELENVTVLPTTGSSSGLESGYTTVTVNESLDPKNDYSKDIYVDLSRTTGDIVNNAKTYTLTYNSLKNEFRYSDDVITIAKPYSYSHDFLDGSTPILTINFSMGEGI